MTNKERAWEIYNDWIHTKPFTYSNLVERIAAALDGCDAAARADERARRAKVCEDLESEGAPGHEDFAAAIRSLS